MTRSDKYQPDPCPLPLMSSTESTQWLFWLSWLSPVTVLIQSRSSLTLSKAVQNSFQAQIEPFWSNGFLERQNYASTGFIFRFKFWSSIRFSSSKSTKQQSRACFWLDSHPICIILEAAIFHVLLPLSMIFVGEFISLVWVLLWGFFEEFAFRRERLTPQVIS